MASLRETAFGSVSARDWSDWRWQTRNRLRRRTDLEKVLPLFEEERRGVEAAENAGGFEWGITPYYLSLVDPADPRDPIRLQCIPRSAEAHAASHELVDPLGEDPKMPVPGLIHRYPDRVLVLATDRCSVYCRFCTRRRLVGTEERQLGKEEIGRILAYLRDHPEVREAILSGGDPLVAGERFLDGLLGALAKVPSIELLRLHTRMPVVSPQRITRKLAAVLRRHQPLWLVTHFNHPYEVTPEANEALALLADQGVPLANQSVLLAGVNSDPVILEALSRELLRARVRPWYLHQGDLAAGTDHFRAPLAASVEILAALRGRLSGLGIPQLIVDLPGGRGKVELAPDRVVAREGNAVLFRAPLGGTARYVDPPAADLACSTTEAVAARYRIGRSPLTSGVAIVPLRRRGA